IHGSVRSLPFPHTCFVDILPRLKAEDSYRGRHDAPISTHLGGVLLRSDCPGALYGVSDPCAPALTFAPQALRPACPAVDLLVHQIPTEDAFGVRGILPRPEGRGLSRISVTSY